MVVLRDLKRLAATSFAVTVVLLAGCTSTSTTSRTLVHWTGSVDPFVDVSGMAADDRGNVWVTEPRFNQLLRVDTHGRITVIARGELSDPHELAVDPAGRLLVADTGNNRIDAVDTAGHLHVVAGTGTPGSDGEGGSAVRAQLDHPQGVAVAQDGDIFIADTANNRIEEVTTDGKISTLAGSGSAGYSGDSGPNLGCRQAPHIQFDHPTVVAADSPIKPELNAENVYLIDAGNNAIRWVRRFVDTSIGPPGPAAVCPQVVSFTPSSGTPRIANPANLASGYGLGTLISEPGRHNLFALSPMPNQPTYSLFIPRFAPNLSPAWTPGAVTANRQLDFFAIDTTTGQLHHTRYVIIRG